jgi:hypothetical protein
MSGIACAVCRKDQRAVRQLIALHLGSTEVYYICDECVVVMVEAIAAGHPDWTEQLLRRLQEKGLLATG